MEIIIKVNQGIDPTNKKEMPVTTEITSCFGKMQDIDENLPHHTICDDCCTCPLANACFDHSDIPDDELH